MFNIKNMRNRARLTQQETADALGVKVNRYGDWERGTTTPNLRDAINMADLFGCTLDELAGRVFPKDGNVSIDAHDRNMIDVYHAAAIHGQIHIDAVVDAEARYINEQAKNEAQSA